MLYIFRNTPLPTYNTPCNAQPSLKGMEHKRPRLLLLFYMTLVRCLLVSFDSTTVLMLTFAVSVGCLLFADTTHDQIGCDFLSKCGFKKEVTQPILWHEMYEDEDDDHHDHSSGTQSSHPLIAMGARVLVNHFSIDANEKAIVVRQPLEHQTEFSQQAKVSPIDKEATYVVLIETFPFISSTGLNEKRQSSFDQCSTKRRLRPRALPNLPRAVLAALHHTKLVVIPTYKEIDNHHNPTTTTNIVAIRL